MVIENINKKPKMFYKFIKNQENRDTSIGPFKINGKYIYDYPVGQKWPFRSAKENRWLFCILLPPKKYYKPYFPGGSLRITDQYI